MFYALAVISAILIPLTNHLSMDLHVHDTYFILTYFHYLVAIAVMSLFTGLIYSLMERLNKPLSFKTALVHFILVVTGLVFSLNVYGLIMIFLLAGVPDTTAFAFDQGLLLPYLTGPVLLISGAFVLIYGIIAALTKKRVNA